MREPDKRNLTEFVQDCLLIRRALSLGTTSLTPTNFSEQKDLFFKSKTYNPTFTYRKFNYKDVKQDIKALQERLKVLKAPKEIKEYLKEYLFDLKLLEKASSSIGTEEFWYHAKRLLKFQPDQITSTFRSLPEIKFQEAPREKLYCAEEIAHAFDHVLKKEYGIFDFTVEIDHFNDHIIRAGGSKVVIGSQVMRFESNVKRLIIHEIESHVLQRYNMKQFQTPLVHLAKYNNARIFGEGIAVYNEITSGSITAKAYQDYYFRLKAVQMLDESFRTIYNYLASYLPESRAFLITYRVKRGMGDTSLSGGFPKDAAYLMGYKTVKEHIKQGMKLDFLYISRVPRLTCMLLRHNLLQEADIKIPSFIANTSTPSSVSVTSRTSSLSSSDSFINEE